MYSILDCSFKIAFPNKNICFSNRDYEVEAITSILDKYNAFPLIIYGPEGCGKTTLFKYLVYRVSKLGYLSIYIDALAHGVERIVYPSNIASLFKKVLGEVLDSSLTGSSISYKVIDLVKTLLDTIKARKKGLFLVVDDVYKAIGLDNVDRYTKMVYEWISWSLPRLGVRKALVVILTSEGVSKRILSKHTYLVIDMLWNIGYNGFIELVKQLDPPIDYNALWKLVGGNPRMLYLLAQLEWSIDKLYAQVYSRVREQLPTIKEELSSIGYGISDLGEVIDNPDSNSEIARILEKYNYMIRLWSGGYILKSVKSDQELGIGFEWAWQTPLYRDVFKKLLESI